MTTIDTIPGTPIPCEHEWIADPDRPIAFGQPLGTYAVRVPTNRPMRWAWPGGYAMIYLTHDGGILCADCVAENLDQCSDPHDATGWRVTGWDHTGNTDDAGDCDHCNRPIE